MRTDAEILQRIERIKGNDFFGFQTGDLIGFLPIEAARPFLSTPDEAAATWVQTPRDRASLIAQMTDYMSFAWGKANDRRGLSAGRSIEHMAVWLWMLGEDAAAEAVQTYSLYGKPQLRAICEHYGIAWEDLDDGEWVNREDGPACRMFAADLPFRGDAIAA